MQGRRHAFSGTALGQKAMLARPSQQLRQAVVAAAKQISVDIEKPVGLAFKESKAAGGGLVVTVISLHIEAETVHLQPCVLSRTGHEIEGPFAGLVTYMDLVIICMHACSSRWSACTLYKLRVFGHVFRISAEMQNRLVSLKATPSSMQAHFSAMNSGPLTARCGHPCISEVRLVWCTD
jgi:hypothetical protein